jgi:hypothetical protein
MTASDRPVHLRSCKFTSYENQITYIVWQQIVILFLALPGRGSDAPFAVGTDPVRGMQTSAGGLAMDAARAVA